MTQPAQPLTDTVLNVERSANNMRWKWRTQDERAVLAMSQKMAISDILARVLVGRGVMLEDAATYLHPTLRDTMPDPLHLRDMDQAVTRLARAIRDKETIGIFGDYDVDGATSSALLGLYFQALEVPHHIYIPDRMKEGYGPSIAAFLSLQAQGVSVIITVDCGAVSFEPLSAAKQAGLDVIVLDHHIGAAQLPEAVAVVNPNRLDETSSCRNLAAVGVTFLTLVALNRSLREAGWFAGKSGKNGRQDEQEKPSPSGRGLGEGHDASQPSPEIAGAPSTSPRGRGIKEPNLLDSLDLVALGTVCDVVPLMGLNRALVRQGLSVMAAKRNQGIRALCEAAGLEEAPTTYHAGYVIGPRINAGGRVGESSMGVRLLTTHDADEAQALAARLSEYNQQRQAIEMQVLEAAMHVAHQQAERSVLLVAGDGWHEGVIGIVAGRIKEHFHRPAAVIAWKDGVGKGSARSVPGVDLGAAIAAARTEGLLLAGGGHAMAAGFTLLREQLDAFHAYLEARIGQHAAHYREQRSLSIDACLNPDALSLELPDMVALAGPFGTSNPAPRFVLAHCAIVAVDILKESHVRLTLSREGRLGNRTTALAFRCMGTPLGELLVGHAGRPLHLAGQIKKEFWQGNARVSFFVDDAALAG
ncbi:MAG: single-stranded-DNA-specific exonuclease RecJ [Rickettsiales bacterium]|nr:single-stranded-DNA-specific exonuclease RecJ [Rickettsiales bacterium]